jgi:Glycosyltransferase 61
LQYCTINLIHDHQQRSRSGRECLPMLSRSRIALLVLLLICYKALTERWWRTPRIFRDIATLQRPVQSGKIGDEVVLSSRERLAHFLNSSLQADAAICNAQSQDAEDIVDHHPTTPNVTFANCARMDYGLPLTVSPRTLLKCPAIRKLMDDDELIIVPRDDLFTEVASSLKMGTVHFHYYYRDSNPLIQAVRRIEDAETLFRRLRDADWREDRREEVVTFASKALNCRCHDVFVCRCPLVLNDTSSNAKARVFVNVQNSIVTGVRIPNFCPMMHEMPNQSTTLLSPLSFRSSASPQWSGAKRTVDSSIPSVAVFRKVYAEVGTSRVFVSRAPPKDCLNKSGGANRQYLVQFNQCKATSSMDYAPFRLHITATTLAEESGAQVLESVILITAVWSTAFYHATVENLPRLLMLLDFIEANPEVIVIACQHTDTEGEGGVMYAFAKAWGLESRMMFLAPEAVIYANLLYIPEPTHCGELNPLIALTAQSAIRQKIESLDPMTTPLPTHGKVPAETAPTGEESDDWIVVIRRRGGRSIRNHDFMMTALLATSPKERWYIFDEGNLDGKFPPAGMSQWRVFSRAKIVIAPHGAGLANILACAPGTHILEFLGEGSDCNLCYLSLAMSLNMNYHPLFMNAIANGNYEVDVPRVVSVVREVLQLIESTDTTVR